MFPSARYLPLQKDIKGVRFFDTGFHHTPWWYRGHFPSFPYRYSVKRRLGLTSVVLGEASPYYLFHPLAAERAARLVPKVKIIVLLRNPVDRAFSHYRERRSKGVETMTFEEALDAEPLRLAGEAERLRADPNYYSFCHEHLSYVSQSLYCRPLGAWLDRFPRSSVLVLRSEDLFEDSASVLQRTLRFLGVDPVSIGRAPRLNAAAEAALDDNLRARLSVMVAEDVENLQKTLGIDFGWNLGSAA